MKTIRVTMQTDGCDDNGVIFLFSPPPRTSGIIQGKVLEVTVSPIIAFT
jgi:hypothetical protein